MIEPTNWRQNYKLMRFELVESDGAPWTTFLLVRKSITDVKEMLQYRDFGDCTEESVAEYWNGKKQPIQVNSLQEVEEKYWNRVLDVDDTDYETTIKKFFGG